LSDYLCNMDKEKLIKEYEGGKAISALSKEFGVSRQAVLGHLKRAGVYKVTPRLHVTSKEVKEEVTPPREVTGVTPKKDVVDLYEYAASLPKLEVYDNGAGSVCPVSGNRYYFELLDMWLPVVRDEGPLRDYVEYLPLGKRFKRGHPHHPDNAWKIDPTVRHPYMV